MNKIAGEVRRTNEFGGETVDKFFTYSEEESQENKINKANAKLLFSFKYLTIPREIFLAGLSGNDAIILAFIHSWLSTENSKFYFTNAQLAELFNLSEQGISNLLGRLKKEGFIEIVYRRKANGGRIKFINIPATKTNFKSRLKQSYSSDYNKVIGNINKINKNNINNKESKKSSFKEKAQEIVFYWNDTYGRRFKVPAEKGWLTNFERWLKTYSLEEIKEALDIAETEHSFYKDKIAPDMLFRSHEDRIGQMLNYKPKEKKGTKII